MMTAIEAKKKGWRPLAGFFHEGDEEDARLGRPDQGLHHRDRRTLRHGSGKARAFRSNGDRKKRWRRLRKTERRVIA